MYQACPVPFIVCVTHFTLLMTSRGSVLSPFHRRGSGDPERLSDLPWVTRLCDKNSLALGLRRWKT